ncbi:MAG: hypothetical protein AAGD11_12085 [Planctomycetota bacterium]
MKSFANPIYRRTLSFESLEERQVLSATFQDAGIEQQAIDAINASQYSTTILADEILHNALDAIADTEIVPAGAAVLTTAADLSQIAAGTPSNPNVYLIQGDLTITSNIEVPSNVHIYVDGSIFKQGNHTAPGGVHTNSNNDDAIFMIDGTDNIKLIGIDNALLHSNSNLAAAAPHATAVFIGTGSSNIEVNGFKISNVWEALVARGFNEDVKFLNNYIQNTVSRAIHSIASQNLIAAHNFIVNAGVDGLDWDAFTDAAIGYENVVIGAGRWAGFVEEAAHDSYLIRGLALMVDLGNPNRGFMLGWADNGTTFSDPITRDNYFIDNVIFDPGNIPQSGGDYFANANVGGKGQTYFWANRGFGAGQSTTNFTNAEWLDFLPTAGGKNNAIDAVQLLAGLDAQFNVPEPGDFNDDGFVDVDDLLQWQADYAQNADSDGNQDGDSDGGDFLAWQINYRPAPPPTDIVVTILDTDYTGGNGYVSGNLASQQGWVGQPIAQVDASGTGTVSSVGGPFDRNMYNTGVRGGNGSSPSDAGFNANDRIEITFDYQFTLPNNGNNGVAQVGIRGEGPMASNNFESRPQQGFELAYSAFDGGQLRLFPDLNDNNPSDGLIIDAANVGISSTDLVSDNLRVFYQATTDGAGNWSVESATVENLDSGDIFTYEGTTQTFSYAATDAFFSQILAFNSNAAFNGVTDGAKFVYIDPIDPPAALADQRRESTSSSASLLAIVLSSIEQDDGPILVLSDTTRIDLAGQTPIPATSSTDAASPNQEDARYLRVDNERESAIDIAFTLADDWQAIFSAQSSLAEHD